MPKRSSAPGAADREQRSVRVLVGERIARAREAAGMTQADLAARFGVSRSVLSGWEVGVGDVSAGDLPYLAELLGVPITYFFSPRDARKHETVFETVVFALFPRLSEKDQATVAGLVSTRYAGEQGAVEEIVDQVFGDPQGPESGGSGEV